MARERRLRRGRAPTTARSGGCHEPTGRGADHSAPESADPQIGRGGREVLLPVVTFAGGLSGLFASSARGQNLVPGGVHGAERNLAGYTRTPNVSSPKASAPRPETPRRVGGTVPLRTRGRARTRVDRFRWARPATPGARAESDSRPPLAQLHSVRPELARSNCPLLCRRGSYKYRTNRCGDTRPAQLRHPSSADPVVKGLGRGTGRTTDVAGRRVCSGQRAGPSVSLSAVAVSRVRQRCFGQGGGLSG
jgi:hypothetical protein